MTLKLDLIGKELDPLKHSYDWQDCVLYALGVGAKNEELDYLFEMNGPKVLPTFAVVPSFTALAYVAGRVGANLMQVLHGEQKIILHRPIPAKGEFSTVGKVTGIYDKIKGAVVVVEAKTYDENKEPVFDNVFSIFVRGSGDFGGDRGPEALKAEPPEGKEPDFVMEETTSLEQHLLYRLSGDYNPLHASPQVAKMSGFDRPILHGLCTYGHAGRAILKHACNNDVTRFKSFSARFAGVVFPGDTLITMGWKTDDNNYIIRVKTQDGRTVISNSIAEVA